MQRPAVFWFLVALLALVVLLLVGQVLGLVNYDLAVRWGLQEPASAVSAYGVVVNRAFALADTVFYLPLVLLALAGLWQRRPWAPLLTAASLGITAYWPLMSLAMLQALPGTAGYSYEPAGYIGPLLVGTGQLALIGLLWLLRDWELVR